MNADNILKEKKAGLGYNFIYRLKGSINIATTIISNSAMTEFLVVYFFVFKVNL